MDIIDFCLITLMIFGIVFYAACLIYFLRGKIKTDGANQRIALGSFELNSNSFIFLAIISALFAFSPVLARYIPTAPEPQPGKIDYITYEVEGTATDKFGKNMKGVDITAQLNRKEKMITKQMEKTEQNGHYSFTFDSVKVDDEIKVIWFDPEGSENERRFSPKKAILDLCLENN